MTKIRVDEIEALSTNQNVEIKTNNTGTLEVQGGTNDGTLQLNCSAQSHGVKLKSPPNSAGQNYTMVLPDNQIAASKFLKVKSVTGDVGQLEYADQPVADLSNLDASNLTSGTIPSARYSLPATSGAGLQFVSESVVGSTAVSQIDITGLEQDTMYKLIIKNMRFSQNTFPEMLWFNGGTGGNGNGNAIGYQYWNRWVDYSSGEYGEYNGSGNWNATETELRTERWGTDDQYAASAIFSTGSGVENQTSWSIGGGIWMRMMAHAPGNPWSFMELYTDTMTVNGQWLGSIRFQPNNVVSTFDQNTRILLYKFQEA